MRSWKKGCGRSFSNFINLSQQAVQSRVLMLSQSLVMFISLMDVQESYKCTPTHSTMRGGTVCVLLVQAFRTVRVKLYANSLAVQWMEQVQHLGIHRKFNELIILILLYWGQIWESSPWYMHKVYSSSMCLCVCRSSHYSLYRSNFRLLMAFFKVCIVDFVKNALFKVLATFADAFFASWRTLDGQMRQQYNGSYSLKL